MSTEPDTGHETGRCFDTRALSPNGFGAEVRFPDGLDLRRALDELEYNRDALMATLHAAR